MFVFGFKCTWSLQVTRINLVRINIIEFVERYRQNPSGKTTFDVRKRSRKRRKIPQIRLWIVHWSSLVESGTVNDYYAGFLSTDTLPRAIIVVNHVRPKSNVLTNDHIIRRIMGWAFTTRNDNLRC